VIDRRSALLKADRHLLNKATPKGDAIADAHPVLNGVIWLLN
jgi:hypothetical protein